MMKRLNRKTLSAALERLDSNTSDYYAPDQVKPGIVHFGAGNFHRCHQAVYAHELLKRGHLNWGIVGVSMRSNALRNKLAVQDFLYTEVTLAEEARYRIVGSLLKVLVAQNDPQAVIDQVAFAGTALVTTTITEKGYYLKSGSVDAAQEFIQADLRSLESPQTVYGYLAAAIAQRCRMDAPPLTILCCDNIQSGGRHLEDGVHRVLQRHDVEAHRWAQRNVRFASSMVDRVVPATSPALRQQVQARLLVEDAWPVSGEAFSQWVIEDNFAGHRPPFDLVGAVFTNDIGCYEQMKLRLLNAAHSMISVLGYLAGDDSVHEALQRPLIENYVLRTLRENALPVTPLPPEIVGTDYIDEVLQRFRNAELPYAVQQVNTDSSQKIQQRWYPTIAGALGRNINLNLMTFSIAAWVVYVERAVDADDLNDPKRHDFIAARHRADAGETPDALRVRDFLRIAGAHHYGLLDAPTFMETVLAHYRTLRTTNLGVALAQLLNTNEEPSNA